jgi:hypothetical protein
MKVFTAQFSPTSCRFPSFGTNILVSTLFSDILSPRSVTLRCTCFVLYCGHPDHYAIITIYLTMSLQEAGFNPPNYTVSWTKTNLYRHQNPYSDTQSSTSKPIVLKLSTSSATRFVVEMFKNANSVRSALSVRSQTHVHSTRSETAKLCELSGVRCDVFNPYSANVENMVSS